MFYKIGKAFFYLALTSALPQISFGMEKESIECAPPKTFHDKHQERVKNAFKNLEQFQKNVFDTYYKAQEVDAASQCCNGFFDKWLFSHFLFKEVSSSSKNSSMMSAILDKEVYKEKFFKQIRTSQALLSFFLDSPDDSKSQLFNKSQEAFTEAFVNFIDTVDMCFLYRKMEFDDFFLKNKSLFDIVKIQDNVSIKQNPKPGSAFREHYAGKLHPIFKQYSYISNILFNFIKGKLKLDLRGGGYPFGDRLLAYIPQSNPYKNKPSYLFSVIQNDKNAVHGDTFKFTHCGDFLLDPSSPEALYISIVEKNKPIYTPVIYTEKNIEDGVIECAIIDGADAQYPYGRLTPFFPLENFKKYEWEYQNVNSFYKNTEWYEEKVFPLFLNEEKLREEDMIPLFFNAVEEKLKSLPVSEKESFLFALCYEEERDHKDDIELDQSTLKESSAFSQTVPTSSRILEEWAQLKNRFMTQNEKNSSSLSVLKKKETKTLDQNQVLPLNEDQTFHNLDIKKNNDYRTIASMIDHLITKNGLVINSKRTKGSHNIMHFSNPETGHGSGVTLVKPHGRRKTISDITVRKILSDAQGKINLLKQKTLLEKMVSSMT